MTGTGVLNDEASHILLHLYPHPVLFLDQVPVLGEGEVLLSSSGESNIEPDTVATADRHLLEGSGTPGRGLNQVNLFTDCQYVFCRLCL